MKLEQKRISLLQQASEAPEVFNPITQQIEPTSGIQGWIAANRDWLLSGPTCFWRIWKDSNGDLVLERG